MKRTKFPSISFPPATSGSMPGRADYSTVLQRMLSACCVMSVLCVASVAPLYAQTLTTLATLDVLDGAEPNASLVQGPDGNLYGTTETGGNTSCNAPNGCGTVFRITVGGDLATLHRFCVQSGCPDGAGLGGALVLATDGNFYGTTGAAGAHNGGTISGLRRRES
jgi:uncharacterized repeat protein (TIGR03803 family)